MIHFSKQIAHSKCQAYISKVFSEQILHLILVVQPRSDYLRKVFFIANITSQCRIWSDSDTDSDEEAGY